MPKMRPHNADDRASEDAVIHNLKSAWALTRASYKTNDDKQYDGTEDG